MVYYSSTPSYRFWLLLVLALGSWGWMSACTMKTVPMPNTIRVISPYYHAGTWVFDDPAVGLRAEPFVAGIPEMIEALVRELPIARKGFRLLFPDEPFPGYQVELTSVKAEYGGHWYRWSATSTEGWLCPALFKYFTQAAETLRAEAIPHP